MSTMNAIKVFGIGDARLVNDAKVPALRDDHILVKPHCVAVNPADFKGIDYFPTPGVTLGSEYAGTVVRVGPKVTKSFKPGDRIFGFVHGGIRLPSDGGAFADYAVVKGDVQMKIPDSMSFEEAATLAVGIITDGLALYQKLGLPLPDDEKAKAKWASHQVLIYGGSTAMGMMAIQYAKLSGLTVATTCSPKNFSLVKELGADYTFDYRSSTCGHDIHEHAKNELHHVLDTIGDDVSVQICREALSKTGHNFYTSLNPFASEFGDSSVNTSSVMAYSGLGQETAFGEESGPSFPINLEDYEYTKMFTDLSERLLQKGELKPLKAKVSKGGLKAVLEGIEEQRQGKVSGEKLVYWIDETL